MPNVIAQKNVNDYAIAGNATLIRRLAFDLSLSSTDSGQEEAVILRKVAGSMNASVATGIGDKGGVMPHSRS